MRSLLTNLIALVVVAGTLLPGRILAQGNGNAFQPGPGVPDQQTEPSVSLGQSVASAPPRLRLLNEARVDSAGIFLHQLVETNAIIGPTPLRIEPAPALGQVAVLNRAMIEARLAKSHPALSEVAWDGPSQVRVARRARLLGEAELKELLTATLQSEYVKDRGEVELRLARPWTPVNVPDETLVLKILDLPATGVSANFILRFEIACAGEHFGPWQTVAQAKLWRDVLVAGSPLKRGQLLSECHVVSERRDVTGLREPFNPAPETFGMWELTENIVSGAALLSRSVRPRPVVQRGRVVDGVIQDGALNITLKVEVLGDGLPGQAVRVRNSRTKREFMATVQNEQTVRIIL